MVLAAICRRCCLRKLGGTGTAGCPPLFLRRAGCRTEHAVACALCLLEGQSWARRSAMESNKPAQNIQDSFLNTARKERTNITIYLLSGVKLTGRIRSFDKYSVVLEANGQEQLIFKHAISTVVMGRVASSHVSHAPHQERAAVAAAAGPVAA